MVDESNGLNTSASGTLDLNGSEPQSVKLSAPGATWNDQTQALIADDGSYRIDVDEQGVYTFTLLAAMDHPMGEGETNKIDFQIDALLTNEFGAEDNTSFTVSVLDDGPVVTVGTGSHLFEYDLGLDGLGEVSLGIPTVTYDENGQTKDFALQSNGEPVSFAITDENGDGLQELHAFVDQGKEGWGAEDEAHEVFSVQALNSSGDEGAYVLNIKDVIDLPENVDGEQQNLDLNFGFSATDADGDAVSGSVNLELGVIVSVTVFQSPDSLDSTASSDDALS